MLQGDCYVWGEFALQRERLLLDPIRAPVGCDVQGLFTYALQKVVDLLRPAVGDGLRIPPLGLHS